MFDADTTTPADATASQSGPASSPHEDDILDVVVVGAGFAGLYALHRFHSLGMSVRGLEAGAGVGGVWYWNRYPGARCDIPILSYSYSFSREIRDTWHWTERYAAQPEIEAYANYVADHLDLRRHIDLRTRVKSAHFDTASGQWTVRTDAGRHLTARYLVLTTGGYSAPIQPDITGIETFAGDVLYTAQWPRDGVDLSGKRVGVLGTGSSGVQTITALGKQGAYDALHVFQRTANYMAPSPNRELTPQDLAAHRETYAEFHRQALESGTGTTNDGPEGPVGALDDAAFEARMQESWAIGGPSSLLGVSDLVTDEGANGRVADFIRRQIGTRVADPEVAEALSPRGHFVGARRTVYENGYFEVFNDPRVTLVNVVKEPIVGIEPTGVRTSERLIGLDTLVLATGFDSGTGPILGIDITTSAGASLRDLWKEGPVTYLGLMVHEIPNLFTIAGPGSPSIRSNVIVSLEQHVDWVADLFIHMRDLGASTVEASELAARAWSAHVADVADSTLITRHDNQYMGSNVPGKPRVFLAYIGGVDAYRKICSDVVSKDYEGFVLRRGSEVLTQASATWSGAQDASSQTGIVPVL